MKRSLVLFVVASMFLLAACSGAGSVSATFASSQSASMGSMGGMGGSGGAGFGQPGDPMSVDRTIDVQLLDSLAFDPANLEVQPGQTIRFRATNAGAVDHEFVLGDEATQKEHESAMESGGSMQMDEANLLTLMPGETRSIVWRFTEPGTVLYGCHAPGHYAAGMVGTIMVMEA
jgi:uncharacterized cupredoxin-like copper-binding protein